MSNRGSNTLQAGTPADRPRLTPGNGAEGKSQPAVQKAAPANSAPPRPFYRRPPVMIAFFVLLVLGVGGIVYGLHARHFEETDDAFVDGHVVPITPQVAAIVWAIHIDDNQLVHKGDLLVELDPTNFQVALQQAQGAQASVSGKLEQAKASVEAAQSAVIEGQAEVDAQQVNFDNADRDLKRYQQLDERAKSQQAQDNALAAQKTALAQVEEAKAKLETAKSQVISAQATVIAAEGDVKKAAADTRQAEVNLGYCKIVRADRWPRHHQERRPRHVCDDRQPDVPARPE